MDTKGDARSALDQAYRKMKSMRGTEALTSPKFRRVFGTLISAVSTHELGIVSWDDVRQVAEEACHMHIADTKERDPYIKIVVAVVNYAQKLQPIYIGPRDREEP